MNKDQAVDFANVIRNEASDAHADYPQYAGHWDGPEWKLYIVRKMIKTKLGTAFLKGEVVLAKEESVELGRGPEIKLVAYSRSNKIDTVIKPSDATLYQPR